MIVNSSPWRERHAWAGTSLQILKLGNLILFPEKGISPSFRFVGCHYACHSDHEFQLMFIKKVHTKKNSGQLAVMVQQTGLKRRLQHPLLYTRIMHTTVDCLANCRKYTPDKQTQKKTWTVTVPPNLNLSNPASPSVLSGIQQFVSTNQSAYCPCPQISIGENLHSILDVVKTYEITSENCQGLPIIIGQSGVRAKMDIPKGTILGPYIGLQSEYEEFTNCYGHTLEGRKLLGFSWKCQYVCEKESAKQGEEDKEKETEVIDVVNCSYLVDKSFRLGFINDFRSEITKLLTETNDHEKKRTEGGRTQNVGFSRVVVNGWPSLFAHTVEDVRKEDTLWAYYGAEHGSAWGRAWDGIERHPKKVKAKVVETPKKKKKEKRSRETSPTPTEEYDEDLSKRNNDLESTVIIEDDPWGDVDTFGPEPENWCPFDRNNPNASLRKRTRDDGNEKKSPEVEDASQRAEFHTKSSEGGGGGKGKERVNAPELSPSEAFTNSRSEENDGNPSLEELVVVVGS